MNPGFEEVMSIRGRGMPEAGEVTITGSDPVFNARFRIGETTANILAGVGVAVTDIHEMKTGKRQKVSIDVRHAAATCQSSKLMRRHEPDGSWKPFEVEDPAHLDERRVALGLTPIAEHIREFTACPKPVSKPAT